MIVSDLGRAALLGIVQGLTEFLPISSSAHLILVPRLLGWPDFGLSFDVALHLGTLAALLIYFAPDWLRLARGLLPASRGVAVAERRLVGMIALGCVPAVVAGILLEDTVEKVFRNPLVIAGPMILMALAMWAADRCCKHTRALEDVGAWDALWIGCAQALALVPGVSRSGSTLTAGMALGLRREDAARFSFLLSAPITAGAALFKLRHLVRDGLPSHERLVFGIGILTSGVVGYLCIAFLLAYLRRGSLLVFVLYRLALGVLLLALFWPRV
jgi:undecaprenyl-diphosphatase